MKNMMKEYLGNEYSSDHLRNFCLYWMKGMDNRDEYESEDEWRKANDLDCMYFDGDLCADTLMSAWTPIKWVADCLNADLGIRFYKRSRNDDDPYHDLKILAEDRDLYLNPEHRLVQLLNRFLELAELRCNFILLPCREMNPARYKSFIRGRVVWLCDEVPSTLAHLYDKDSLGRFFLGEDGEDDEDRVRDWIYREHLEPGFELGAVNRENILPLLADRNPYEPVWPDKEDEIAEALEYMIGFLETRRELLEDPARGQGFGSGESGTVSYTASAVGSSKVPMAVERAFRGVMENESEDSIISIEFDIVSDIPTEQSDTIDRCIRKLCKWYGKDGMIPYGFKYKMDGKMNDACEVNAILHLKSAHKLLLNRSKKAKVPVADESSLTRPEGITSDVLWELYKKFSTQKGIQVWLNPDKNSRGGYRLYAAKEATLGHGETDYGVGSMGIELPWSRKEWIDLTLIQCDTGSIYKTRITTDALYESGDSAEALLARNHMKLA